MLAAVMAGITAMAAPALIQRAYARRTISGMTAMLQGCLQYDALYGTWPSSIAALTGVLPQVAPLNAWGQPFMLVPSADRVAIETDVPPGALSGLMKSHAMVVVSQNGKDRVRMSSARAFGPAARLVYEKRNIYAP
jgi:hypothetical protein